MKITYKFFLNTEKGNGVKFPLYIRLTIERVSAKRSLGFSLTQKDWNQDKEESKLLAVNQKINSLKSKFIFSIS